MLKLVICSAILALGLVADIVQSLDVTACAASCAAQDVACKYAKSPQFGIVYQPDFACSSVVFMCSTHCAGCHRTFEGCGSSGANPYACNMNYERCVEPAMNNCNDVICQDFYQKCVARTPWLPEAYQTELAECKEMCEYVDA